MPIFTLGLVDVEQWWVGFTRTHLRVNSTMYQHDINYEIYIPDNLVLTILFRLLLL